MNKKGYLAAGCSVALLGTIVAGCSTAGTKPEAGTKAADDAKNAKPVTVTWMRYEHPSQPLIANSMVVQESLKRKNIKLEIQSTPQSNYDDKKKTLIATNTLPDVLLVKQDDISNFADTGVFLDLTPYLDKMPNFKKVIADNPEINKNKIDGKLYGFPLAQKLGASQSGQVPVIRVDLLKKLNIPTPTTYEELYQAFKKLKEAYPDTFPFTSRAANGLTGTENLINPIAFGMGSGYTNVSGAKIYYDPALKQYKFGPAMPQFKDAVTYLNKLYREKLLDPDYTTSTSQIWQEKLSSGKSLYYMDNTGFGVNFNTALQKKDPDAQFDMLPILASDKGVKRGLLYQLDHLSESYAISASVKNPDKIIEYIDWIYSEEGTKLFSWGIENEHYTMVDGKPVRKEEFANKFKDKTDPFAAIKSELGTSYLGFALYADDTVDIPGQAKLMTEWTNKNLAYIKDGSAFRMAYDPAFTKEEREKLKQLRTQLDAYLTQTMDKFIMTDGAIDKEWAAFIQQCKDKGSEEIEKIYNTALARVK
ncbi:extracellular solute-binding protein [Paenibacillus sp. WQ 127069]|uniref:Extracellular solute-binding protein n=1 Tax=Paenibacillus baimaensis TaxID=2982185 RepID=A0ABT2UIA4_9BACL|nr:extracellular solute-binding protein [Paenibacillus sp. WQ 127069]MCU6794369.1 extracellular solute-binding protein [Paenibacillus sp. WQ 127069]